jgi:uncharacterized protein YjbI with pentapeptide repeats
MPEPKPDSDPEASILNDFASADQPGTDFSDVDRTFLRKLADQSKKITPAEWTHILTEHQEFLNTGGGGGLWQTMNVNGVILGIYAGPSVTRPNSANQDKCSIQGTHAVLNNRTLEGLPLHGVNLNSANLVGILCQKQDFNQATLEHALITDAFLANTTFREASLIGTDFSRSDMRGCDFSGADLTKADFENCDLTGAFFSGAQLQGAHFPGAILTEIIR